jgi:hypothetical protein
MLILKLSIILFLIYNFRAIWSVAKFRPERSIGYKSGWFHGKWQQEPHWLQRHHPSLFESYCITRGEHNSNMEINDGFHFFQGCMNFVMLFGLLWLAYTLVIAVYVSIPLFIVLESLVFNPLFHSIYTRKGYRDLYRAVPWKFILKNPKKGD